MKVAGADISLLASGLALPDGTFRTIAPPTSSTGYHRHRNVSRRIIEELELSEAGLVVIEDYDRNPKGRTALIRAAEVQGIVRTDLADRNVAIATVPPTTLKKYATGKGNAPKSALFDAALATGLGERADPDYRPANYDESDAYWLRCLGVAILAGVEAALEHLEKIEWPDGVAVPA